jgi:signal recognition particle receptor subunit beta
MAQINYAQREISARVVFYGPGMSGKTTNLEIIHQKAPKQAVGEMVSIATETDRTLYFDFLPLDLGQIQGMSTRFQLYTVPGQIYYNSTRKLVLQGVDGIIFVADSKPDKMAENMESLQNLRDNLREMGLAITDLPVVLQYNKRDLPNAASIEDLDERLNPDKRMPVFEAVAKDGKGVFPTLKECSRLLIEKISKDLQRGGTRRATRTEAGRTATEAGSLTAPGGLTAALEKPRPKTRTETGLAQAPANAEPTIVGPALEPKIVTAATPRPAQPAAWRAPAEKTGAKSTGLNMQPPVEQPASAARSTGLNMQPPVETPAPAARSTGLNMQPPVEKPAPAARSTGLNMQPPVETPAPAARSTGLNMQPPVEKPAPAARATGLNMQPPAEAAPAVQLKKFPQPAPTPVVAPAAAKPVTKPVPVPEPAAPAEGGSMRMLIMVLLWLVIVLLAGVALCLFVPAVRALLPPGLQQVFTV